MLEIGTRYFSQSRFSEGLTFHFDALKLAEKTQNKGIHFRCLAELASFYESNTMHDNALKLALQAEEIASEQNNARDLFEIYDLIGGYIYFNQGNYDKAFEYGKKMLRTAEMEKDEMKIARTKALLGDIYRRQDKFEEGLKIYEEAVKITRRLGEKRTTRAFLNNIGLILGAQKKFDQALSYYMESLAIAEEENFHFDAAFVSVHIANTYVDLRDFP